MRLFRRWSSSVRERGSGKSACGAAARYEAAQRLATAMAFTKRTTPARKSEDRRYASGRRRRSVRVDHELDVKGFLAHPKIVIKNRCRDEENRLYEDIGDALRRLDHNRPYPD